MGEYKARTQVVDAVRWDLEDESYNGIANLLPSKDDWEMYPCYNMNLEIIHPEGWQLVVEPYDFVVKTAREMIIVLKPGEFYGLFDKVKTE